MPALKSRRCKYCGRFFDRRGYPRHVKACPKKLAAACGLTVEDIRRPHAMEALLQKDFGFPKVIIACKHCGKTFKATKGRTMHEKTCRFRDDAKVGWAALPEPAKKSRRFLVISKCQSFEASEIAVCNSLSDVDNIIDEMISNDVAVSDIAVYEIAAEFKVEETTKFTLTKVE